MNLTLDHSELGKTSNYDLSYNPEVLFPIAREPNRKAIGIDSTCLPFYGFDQWNHYEVSWLDHRGKPHVAIAEITYDCSSPFLIESKSLKLYFNSLNNMKFKTLESLEDLIRRDLEERIGSPVTLKISSLQQVQINNITRGFEGTCLDHLDIECSRYTVDSSFLSTENIEVEETVYSDLLKSNCPVTNQPDWGSVQIEYKGKKINPEGLLTYLVSFRNHNEFHEQCIERIFADIMKICTPEELTVYGRYTRRGGLDINPFRSTLNFKRPKTVRFYRQ